MTVFSSKFVAISAIQLICAPVAAGQTPVNPEAEAMALFSKRVAAYVALQKKVESSMPAQKATGDPERIKAWWSKHGGRFQPGTRYFMGAEVTGEHCVDVLKNGYQRQRILAAHYLCLLEPGTPLFNTSAPAWRQQKLLAEMR